MFSAIYLPALPPGTPDPSRDGFATQEEAEAYVDTRVCSGCRKGHQEPDGIDACYFEWFVVRTDKAHGSIEQLFEAAGWKTVNPGEDKDNNDSSK